MHFRPTEEQQYALDLFKTGQNTVIDALAGSGKTSTLQLIASEAGSRRGLYAAFNKAIATEAQQKFRGTSVVAKTMHALAFRDFGARMRDRLSERRIVQWSEKAEILGINDRMVFPADHGASAGALSRQQIVGVVTKTITAYMQSTHDRITPDLVVMPPTLEGLKPAYEVEFRAKIVEYAQVYWDDLTWAQGRMKYDHGAYFKEYALSNPRLPFDFIMLDEAQDSDPLTVQIISNQDAQVITVGDAYQSIYGWRGATNAMDSFDGAHAALTMSFRFGDKIADYANSWLELMGADLRLRGAPDRLSSVFRAEKRVPDAVLTRTNAGAIWEIVQAQDLGLSTSIAGAGKAREIKELAKGALDLQEKGHTSHPELESFQSWGDVVTWAASDDGEDLRPLVEVIEKYTPRKVVRAIDACVDEGRVTVSTAHVSKGLEWIQVKIADDFREPGTGKPILAEEARLAYVASTRAMRHLDPRGLEWLPDYLAAGGWVEGTAGGPDVDIETSSEETAHVGSERVAQPASLTP